MDCNQENIWTIFINDLEVMVKIGIYDTEQRIPQKVIINLKCDYYQKFMVDVNTNPPIICYEKLYNQIVDLTYENFYLSEVFAQKIADICLSYQPVKKVWVRVEKVNTSLKNLQSVGVEIIRYGKF